MNIPDAVLEVGYDLLDKGYVPDWIIRRTIRALLRQRLREIEHGSLEKNHEAKMRFVEDVRSRTTIADVPEKANEQHYEVSTKFMLSTLGPCAKYSSCLYPTGKETLAEAEVLMFESYCKKASLRDGLKVMDLGCGWGSLTLYLAAKYPNSKIIGLSNSTTQKIYIESTAKSRGLSNVEIITADVNTFDFSSAPEFDRILSIEMFEHMKNYEVLLNKISTWLRPTTNETPEDALLFVHIFCHKDKPYHFEEGDGWMAKNFFSGGTMPSHDLLLYFQAQLTAVRTWYLPGTHYSRTLEDWLKVQDKNEKEGLKELHEDAKLKGTDPIEATKAFYRFRVFYMACSELFNFDGGEEWGVGHYLFKRK